MNVIFRKFKNGEVIAWLPGVEANPNQCMSYMHVGQHGEGIYPADTVPAKATEYLDLLDELRGIYAPEPLYVIARYRANLKKRV